MLKDLEKKFLAKNFVLNRSGGFGVEKMKSPFLIICNHSKEVKIG